MRLFFEWFAYFVVDDAGGSEKLLKAVGALG